MTHEEAKQIIQSMANGTATAQEEKALEEWALQEWGTDGCYGRMVVLGNKTPRSGGQLHYRSVREAIDEAKRLAERWCDTIHTHPFIGMVNDDSSYYPVFASEYTERIERAEGGNFSEVSRWRDHSFQQLVQFPCAVGHIKDEGDSDQSGQGYLFDRDFVQCEACAQFNKQALLVVCPQDLANAIATGTCFMEQPV